MTRWKEDETEFTVSLAKDRHSMKCIVPKPVYEKLGEPSSIKYVVKGTKIIVEPIFD